MPTFKYKVIADAVNEQYQKNTGSDLYLTLGSDIDLSKVTLIVEANDEDHADRLRMGITDIRTWELITE